MNQYRKNNTNRYKTKNGKPQKHDEFMSDNKDETIYMGKETETTKSSKHSKNNFENELCPTFGGHLLCTRLGTELSNGKFNWSEFSNIS